MALAVAMVACSGAAGAPGPAGPPGPPGQDAPTPEPTDPPAPTDPPDPPGPTGAAPEVTTPFKDVYLALDGTGKMTSAKVELDKHITDTDSQLKFTASSSDAMIAKLGAMTVNSRDVTITAVRVGTVTITVEARDGDNPALMAQFSVTVVRNNDQPTTNDLSQADRDELEKRLYVSDGTRTDTVTVVASAGVTSSEPVEDSITDFKVVINETDATTDDHVTVKVTKGTGNQYTIDVTPKATSLGMGMQKVEIYPKDMFGAPSSEAWEFNAVYNTPPEALIDSFGVVQMDRTLATAAHAVGETVGTLKAIAIERYFHRESLDWMAVPANAPTTDNTAMRVGDTVCVVDVSKEGFLFVQELNTTATAAGITDTTPADGVLDTIVVANVKMSHHALAAIVLDGQYSSYGANGLVPDAAADSNVATGTGVVDVTIRCTDKDATATVSGKVVIRGATPVTG